MKLYLLAVKKMVSGKDENFVEAFEIYLQAYKIFHKKLISNEVFDAVWSAPLVEHLSILLAKMALIAESNSSQTGEP